MPRLSESMEEGTIVAWLRGDRDTVSRGDELVEIETDKATMVHEADYSGVLTIVVREKETVPVGTVIAIIGSGPGPDDDDAREEGVPASAERSEEVASKEPVPASPRGGPVQVSPVARRLAHWLGVEIEQVSGSGRGGRVMKADVRSHASDRWTAVEAEPTNGDISRPGEAAPTPGPGPATAKGESTFVELSRTQQLIARRMSASRATVPSFEVSGEVDMTAVFARRVALRAEATDRPVPSLNDFVIRACALALRQFPRFNGSHADGRLGASLTRERGRRRVARGLARRSCGV